MTNKTPQFTGKNLKKKKTQDILRDSYSKLRTHAQTAIFQLKNEKSHVK